MVDAKVLKVNIIKVNICIKYRLDIHTRTIVYDIS